LTVADVWVDHGKARADGLDQSGCVRVIQKPTAAVPERFPSVDQDWDAAVAAYEHKRATKIKKQDMERQFPAIQEEDEESSKGSSQRSATRSLSQSQMQWTHSPDLRQHTKTNGLVITQKSPIAHRHRDLPLSSVEVGSPVTTPPPAKSADLIIAGTPPLRRESEELGDSPSPTERRASTTRSRSTPGSVKAITPKSQTRSPKLVKPLIAKTTARRTITQMPSDVESPPNDIHVQRTQTTEEATPSGESSPEPAPQHTPKLPTKPRVANGQRHLARVAESLSKSSQKKPAEPVVVSSSEESSEEESDDEDEQRKALVQESADEDSETNSDASDSGSGSDSDSESDASEENGTKEEPITPLNDQNIPNGVESEDIVDGDGDLQMKPPTATKISQSRKRKQSSDDTTSVKEARQGQSHPSTRQQSNSTSPRSVPAVVVSSQPSQQSKSKLPSAAAGVTLPLGLTSPQRRERAPSFSSPARRASILEEPAVNKSTKSGLGLGITESPPSNQPVMLEVSQESVRTADLPSTQNSTSFSGPLFPSSNATVPESSFTPVDKQTPAIERTKKLSSALRSKDSPASERRSVSFAEGENLASTLEPVPHSSLRNTAVNTTPKPALQTPTPAARTTQATPSTSTRVNATPKSSAKKQTPKPTSQAVRTSSQVSDVVYPPNFDVAKLEEEVAKERQATKDFRQAEAQQKEKEKAEKAEIARKLRETYDPELLNILTEMTTLLGKLGDSRLGIPRRIPLRSKLDELRQEAKAREQTLEAQKATPQESLPKQARPTLKDMLSSQKQELAAKSSQPRVEAKPAPARRSDVYDVPSSGESESESESSDDSSSDSDSESGDIMPDGHSEKLRRPSLSQRSS
jgi:hypothetical protein